MNKNKILIITSLAFLLFIQNNVSALIPTNFSRPYDVNFRLADWKNTKFKFGVNVETGSTSRARDGSENKNGLLQRYNPTESSLAMLMGAPKGTETYDLASKFLAAYGPATDDGVRGHFVLDGKFYQTELTFFGQYRLPLDTVPGKFDLFVYLPIENLSIKNIQWYDQTKSVLNADKDVHRYLTDDISGVAQELGGLDVGRWSKTGLGDLIVMLGWHNDFRQLKEYLKNVRLSARLGFTAPTGAKKNEDVALSLPMGNDGSWGIPFTVGIDLDFVHRIRAGIEFEAVFSFDDTSTRRLKTDVNQTDFLLLHKGRVTKSPGFLWKFNLFLQARRFLGGLSFLTAYQFSKHDDDRMSADSNDFSYNIINTAESLKEWGFQNFIFQLNYDFFKEFKRSWFKPQISLFYKLPVTGKRVINPHTFGGQLAFNF